jgi:hypothetical protein
MESRADQIVPIICWAKPIRQLSNEKPIRNRKIGSQNRVRLTVGTKMSEIGCEKVSVRLMAKAEFPAAAARIDC